jgi:hypothetical protein
MVEGDGRSGGEGKEERCEDDGLHIESMSGEEDRIDRFGRNLKGR